MPNDLTIDLTDQPRRADGLLISPREDGSLDINLDGVEQEEAQPTGFGENLADGDRIQEADLSTIASDVIAWVQADEESRKPWEDRLQRGLRSLGLIKPDEHDANRFIEGSSKVVHPMLVEGAIQFNARAIKEIFPSSGPVKGQIVGKQTKDIEAQRDREVDFMNYQLTVQDKGYFWDRDQMAFYLPFGGSAFVKTWYDGQRQMLLGRFIKSGDMIVPYEATRGDEPRMTHRIVMSHNTLKRYQRKRVVDGVEKPGLYRDIELFAETTRKETLSSLSDQSGQPMVSGVTEWEGDHELLECHCEYLIKSLDQDGDYSEIAWPYIITVDRDNSKVLSIYRNWKEDDDNRVKLSWFTKYDYLPGLGYYGFGLFHAIGGLAEAASESLRALLDSASAANFQGGFKSNDARPSGGKAGEIRLKFGVYQDIDVSGADMKNMFYTPPFKEPSRALFEVLGLLVDGGHRFLSTTEAMVGEGANNVPVGTTVARIEQGSMVYSGIHLRMHRAAGEEFEVRAVLNAEHIPEGGYPYQLNGVSKQIFKQDFDGRVDIIPVSDPNIFSSTQRIAIAQTKLQLAQQFPQFHDTREALVGMYRALGVGDIDTLMPDPDMIPSRDPVSEGQMALSGKPIKAYLHQAHDMHSIVHMTQLEMWQASPMGKQIVPVLLSHIAEHTAMAYRLKIMAQLGIPLPDPDDKKLPQLPPEAENAIATAVAQQIQQMQQQMRGQQQPDPKLLQAEADIKRKDALTAADIARRDKMTQAEIARDDAAMAAKQSREHHAAVGGHLQDSVSFHQGLAKDQQQAEVDRAAAYLQQAGVTDIQPLVLVEAQRELKLDLQKTLELLMKIRAGGQSQGMRPDVLGGNVR